ncbi:hypothetical protein OL229_10790 [Neisseriaceae bacterium JH1-16]|nr:hypothetical protein [Neisseriaceae bacterium JH1-16]
MPKYKSIQIFIRKNLFHNMKYRELEKLIDGGSSEHKRYLDFLRENTMSRSYNLADAGNQYEIEAVKHLAILNSAGVAAVVALISAGKSHSLPCLMTAIWSFVFGLILAAIVMISAAYLLYRCSRTIISSWNKFIRGEIDSEEIRPNEKLEDCWHLVNIALGVTSLLLFFYGVFNVWEALH